MQECAEKYKGAMYAVLKISASQVENICASIEGAYPVNYNSPGQTVVACSEGVAESLQKSVLAAGGKTIKLAVSGAFHSPFMNSASRSIAEYLKNKRLDPIHIPLYANINAEVYDNPKELLAKQVNHPVLWQKTVENMITDSFDTFIEVGPGKTLSRLIKNINPDMQVHNVSDVESLEKTLKELK
jgi:[acyl-carrier-protein] S-malonyltransferase